MFLGMVVFRECFSASFLLQMIFKEPQRSINSGKQSPRMMANFQNTKILEMQAFSDRGPWEKITQSQHFLKTKHFQVFWRTLNSWLLLVFLQKITWESFVFENRCIWIMTSSKCPGSPRILEHLVNDWKLFSSNFAITEHRERVPMMAAPGCLNVRYVALSSR